MIKPIEMQETRPMELRDGIRTTTTAVWSILSASGQGESEPVQELVETCPGLASCQFDYTTPLHMAVLGGHRTVVEYLLHSGGIDPDYRTHPFLDSLVTMAEDREQPEIAEMLKDSLANPALTRSWGDTWKVHWGKDELQQRFERCVDKGQLDEVKAILQDRPALAQDPTAFWGEGLLAMPAKDANRPMLELLLQHGARVPTLSKWGARYYFKHYEIAAFLLENGMDPNHMNWRCFTLLHDMAFTGDVQKAVLLLDYGADINAIDDEYSSTPFGYAARWGGHEIIDLLVSRGADVHQAGAPWATPTEWARKKGHPEIAAKLKRAGAD